MKLLFEKMLLENLENSGEDSIIQYLTEDKEVQWMIRGSPFQQWLFPLLRHTCLNVVGSRRNLEIYLRLTNFSIR